MQTNSDAGNSGQQAAKVFSMDPASITRLLLWGKIALALFVGGILAFQNLTLEHLTQIEADSNGVHHQILEAQRNEIAKAESLITALKQISPELNKPSPKPFPSPSPQ